MMFSGAYKELDLERYDDREEVIYNDSEYDIDLDRIEVTE